MKNETINVEPGPSFLTQVWASIAATVILCVLCCGLYPLIVWGIAQGVFPNKADGSLVKRDGSYTTQDSEAVGSALIGQNFSRPGYFHPRPSAAGNGYDPTSSGGTNLGPLSDKLLNGATQAPTPQPGAAPTTQPAAETLAFDGIRLRTIHYAVDNGLSFTLYSVKPDGSKTPVPLKHFQDAQGNLNDVALVDAFPHPATDSADRVVLIAADFHRPDGAAVEIPADAVTASASGLDPHVSPANALLQEQRVADARKIPVAKVAALVDQFTDRPDFGFLGDAGVNVLRLNLALDAGFPAPAAPTTNPTK